MTAPPVPPLAEFLRWLAEMPDAFSAEPLGFAKGEVSVVAVVADLYETYFGAFPDEALLAAFRPANAGKVERNRHRWVLAGRKAASSSASAAVRTCSSASSPRSLSLDIGDRLRVAAIEALAEAEDRGERADAAAALAAEVAEAVVAAARRARGDGSAR